MKRYKNILYKLQVVGSYFYYYRNKEVLTYNDYVDGYTLLYGSDVPVQTIERTLRKYSEPYAPYLIWERIAPGKFVLIDPLPIEEVREELRRRGTLMRGLDALNMKTKLFNLDLDMLFVFYMISNGFLVYNNKIATNNYIESNIKKLLKSGLVKYDSGKFMLTNDAKKLKDALVLLVKYFYRKR